MEDNKHPHFENPTIIEAVIEIRLLQTIGKSEQENLEDSLSTNYQCTKDEFVVYTATFNTSGMSLQHDKPGQQRLKFQLGKQFFVYFYPDKFSFHWLGKYPGWDTIQGHFREFCQQLFKAHPEICGTQIGVRFINKLDEKAKNQEVGFWLKSSKNYPESILSVQSNYFCSCKWPLNSGRRVQICIAEGQGDDSNSMPLMFDIDVIEEFKQPLTLESSLSEHIRELHDEVFVIFQSSLSSNYLELLNKKRI